jgi:hypothetical protein
MLLWTIYIKSVALYQLSYLVTKTRAGLEPAHDYCSNRAELSRFATRVGFEPTTDSDDYFLANNQNLQIKLNSKTSFANAKRILQ